jgi:small ligand-binding sensory domain FIST
VSPVQRLREMATSRLDEEDVRLVNQGLHLGVVVDERKVEFGPGDFLVRNVLGGDPDNGAIAVGDVVEVGRTVQYHVRDAAGADVELRRLLADAEAEAALLFTCNGRGRRLFGEPDHDARILYEALDGAPVAGFFAAGELGPVGGRNAVHGFTASIALFD